jgi:thioredoxin 1
MLYTNLKHLESAADHKKAISENENVMVICGRMGPMCIPVYGIAEELEEEFKHVKLGIPFTIYYKGGKVVKATSSIQTKDLVKAILNKEFSVKVSV